MDFNSAQKSSHLDLLPQAKLIEESPRRPSLAKKSTGSVSNRNSELGVSGIAGNNSFGDTSRRTAQFRPDKVPRGPTFGGADIRATISRMAEAEPWDTRHSLANAAVLNQEIPEDREIIQGDILDHTFDQMTDDAQLDKHTEAGAYQYCMREKQKLESKISLTKNLLSSLSSVIRINESEQTSEIRMGIYDTEKSELNFKLQEISVKVKELVSKSKILQEENFQMEEKIFQTSQYLEVLNNEAQYTLNQCDEIEAEIRKDTEKFYEACRVMETYLDYSIHKMVSRMMLIMEFERDRLAMRVRAQTNGQASSGLNVGELQPPDAKQKGKESIFSTNYAVKVQEGNKQIEIRPTEAPKRQSNLGTDKKYCNLI